jgi:hypothetical protein
MQWGYKAGADEDIYRARRMVTEVLDNDLIFAHPQNEIIIIIIIE